MKNVKHNDTFINVGEKGHFYLSTEKVSRENFEYGYINTNLMLDANYETEYQGMNVMPTDDFFLFKSLKEKDGGMEISFSVDTKKLEVTENVEFIKGLNVIRQTTTVKNDGNDCVRLARLTAANVTGIGIDGSKYFDTNRFDVHYCLNHMQGEGQWQVKSMKELGIYPASTRLWERTGFRIQSFASWSTNDYYPLIIIEDKERGECWFFEREGAENWYMEVYACEGWGCPFINVSLGGSDENMGWTYDLKPKESYTTTTAVYGVVKGGFEEAVRELTAYKRFDSVAKTKMEASYNTFMNCNWGTETKERVMPLVDAAAEAGCECFVIDSGWEVPGAWTIREDNWPNNDFKEIIDYIRSKGMRAGAWMELDCAGKAFEDEYLRRRDGKIITHHRLKTDLRNPVVKERLLDAVDRLYKLGIRFIKNDHNNDERCGSNYPGESAGEGTRRNTLAFYELIKEIRARYPDLVLENCAAGGAREENGTLRYFSLQSTSDQEDYRLYPSILIGSMANMPPEKCGIWGYPYPLTNIYAKPKVIPDEVIKTFEDGRETVFNLVSAMSGFMYLSGKINLMNDLNKKLLKEGVKVYKSYKDTIPNRMPAFVLPMKNMDDKTFNAVGLKGDSDMILSVWALEQTEFTLDLNKYGFDNIERIYPTIIDNANFSYSDKKLTLHFKEKYSACLFKLK